MKNWKSQKMKAAVNYFQKGDEEFNDSSCQCALGEIYLTHQNGSENHDMALQYFEKAAAQQGQAKPYYFLGIMYLTGNNAVESNLEKASIRFTQSGEIDSNNFIELGKAYTEGMLKFPVSVRGGSKEKRTLEKAKINKDYTNAIKWFTKAFEKNREEVCPLIAQIYLNGGYGVDRDFKQAIHWCDIALEQRENGTSPCHDIAAQIFSRGGYGIDKDIQRALSICQNNGLHYRKAVIYETQFDLPCYKDAAVMYKKVQIDHPYYPKAIERLGWFYYKGLGVKKDDSAARSYFKSEYCADRLYYNGLCQHEGIDTDKNYKLAHEAYIRASRSQQKSGCALHKIGLLLQLNNQKDDNALAYFRNAAAADCHHGYNSLGDAYRYGNGVTINYDTAFHYYLKAAESHDDCEGQYNLGIMYLEGKGTEIDRTLALHWLKKAHILGNMNAAKWFANKEWHYDMAAVVDVVKDENTMLKKELYNILGALNLEKQRVASLTDDIRRLGGEVPEHTITYNELIEETLPSYH